MKKRSFVILLMVFMLVSLFGCGQENQSANHEEPLIDFNQPGPPPLLQGGNPLNDPSVIHYGDVITLQSNQFRKYAGGDVGNLSKLAVSASVWEKWVILKAGDISSTASVKFNDKILLRSLHSNQYLGGNSVNNYTTVKLASSAPGGGWEEWLIIDPNDSTSMAEVKHNNKAVLKLCSGQFTNSPYLSGNGQGDNFIVDLAHWASVWEQWLIGKWSINPWYAGELMTNSTQTLHYGDIITLKSNFFQDYLDGDGDSNTSPSRYPTSWEQWIILDADNLDSTAAVNFKQNKVLLKSVFFEKYLSGRSDNSVKLSGHHESWEEWVLIDPDNPDSVGEVLRSSTINLTSFNFGKQLMETYDAKLIISSLPFATDGLQWTVAPGHMPDQTGGKLHYGDMIALKNGTFKNFAGGDEGNHGKQGNLPRAWEQWRIINPIDSASTATVKFNDMILLLSRSFSKYLSGDPNNHTISLSPNQWSYEAWKMIDSANSGNLDEIQFGASINVALSQYANKYLSGSSSSLSVADWAYGWEAWSLHQLWITPDRWMSKIPDDTKLSRITIPGTHDSGTYKLSYIPFAQTQTRDIREQLNSGIRFLDIRLAETTYFGLAIVTDGLIVVHGDFSAGLWFSEVITACKQFLQENPSETILMSVKRDSGDGSIYDRFLDYYNNDPKLWYVGISDPYTWPTPSTAIPSIAAVRGKIVLMTRNGMSGTYGIPLDIGNNAQSNQSAISGTEWLFNEDYYAPNTDGGKKEIILWHVQNAQNDSSVNNMWITFTSANKPLSLKGPDYYALEGGNNITGKWLNINGWMMGALSPENGPMGIIPMDFPTSDDQLIPFLLRANDFR